VVSSLYLMPTEGCNCICDYCYLEERSRTGDSSLFRKVTESWIDWLLSSRIAVTGRPQIRFTGGEPWLEPELLCDITRSFLDAIPEGWVVVNTNGTLFPEDLPCLLRGEHRFKSVVSLDGPAAVHDARRSLCKGGSAYAAAMKGIMLLLDLELPVYINAVVDEYSIDGLSGLMDTIGDELELDSLSISLLMSPDSCRDPNRRFDLLRRAYSMAEAHGLRLGGHHRLLLGHLIPGLECRAGMSTALIDASGGVNACQRFVGRAEPDCIWTEDFDWDRFASGQSCGSVCRSPGDQRVGKLLYDLYTSEYRQYLSVDQLDRVLFGVIQ
jgi:sulfatase maturation enzyme AslB (radical SAM superfamily)